jgi:opine dehydrogenase
MSQMKISVLGAGNGGQALAADLSRRGCDVTIFEHPDFASSVAPIAESGRIGLVGTFEGTFPVRTTTSGEVAAKGAKYLFMVSPSFAQFPLFNEVLPWLEEGATVVFIPGNFFSFEASRLLREKRPGVDITLVESDTLPYACRLVEPGTVNIWGIKQKISMAALPADRTEALIQELKSFFVLDVWKAPNTLAIGLQNMNMVFHSSGVLLNAGRIESTNGEFRFYTDGVTESVGKLQQKIDDERVATGKAFGLTLKSGLEYMQESYGTEGKTLHEVVAKNPAYSSHGNDAPKTVTHRYVTEDVPYLLVPMLGLASAAGVSAPVSDALVTMWSAILDRNFREEGRTLSRLGLDGMSVQHIVNRAEKGY